MEMSYRIFTVKSDGSKHMAMSGLNLKDAMRILRIQLSCKDPNEPIYYGIEDYVHSGRVSFVKEKGDSK